MLIPTDNPLIFKKTKHPHLPDWNDWFRERLGKPYERFIGEHGSLHAYNNRLSYTKGEHKQQLKDDIRKTEQRIRIMESLISKGALTTTPDFASFDLHETALYELLRRKFLLEWYLSDWDNPKFQYLARFIRNYVRIKYYDKKAERYTHGYITRQAARLTKDALARTGGE